MSATNGVNGHANGSAATNGGSGVAANGANGTTNGSAASAASPLASLKARGVGSAAASPSSYLYTSSSSLLKGTSAKPVPPPTLPKYATGGLTPAVSLTSSATSAATSSSSASTYRLASLDRLAQRQRLFEAAPSAASAAAASAASPLGPPPNAPPPVPTTIPGSGSAAAPAPSNGDLVSMSAMRAGYRDRCRLAGTSLTAARGHP